MNIPHALNRLHHTDYNYGEFATIISIMETTATDSKTNNTHYYSLDAIRE